MTPGEHTARVLALRELRLEPLDGIAPISLDTERPPRQHGTVGCQWPTPGDGTTPLPAHVEDYLQSRYAHPLPVVTTRRPGRARRALVAAGWWLLKGIPAAVVIGLAFLLAHGILSQFAER